MLGMSKGSVNETALGDATRRRVRHDATVTKGDDALGHSSRESSVAKSNDDGVSGPAALGDPLPGPSCLSLADVDQMNERLVCSARFVERRTTAVQPRPPQRRPAIRIAKPRDRPGVRHDQTRGTEKQRRLARTTG